MDTTDLAARLEVLMNEHPTLSAYGLNWRPVPGITLEQDRAELRARLNQISTLR